MLKIQGITYDLIYMWYIIKIGQTCRMFSPRAQECSR